MNTMNSPYYKGFIDTCNACGLDKYAAATLYKYAAPAPAKSVGWLRNLFKWVAKGRYGAEDAWVASKDLAVRGGELVRDVAKDTGAAIGDVYAEAARATRELNRTVRRSAIEGWNDVRAARGLDPLPLVEDAVPAAKKSVNHFWPLVKGVGSLIRKYPIISTLGASVGTAYLVNKINEMNKDDNGSRSKLPALTPSERAMHERRSSGMDLPGLGLDPRFFNGSWYDSYLYD